MQQTAIDWPKWAVDNNIATFDGVTGKLIKDSGVTINQYLHLILKKNKTVNEVKSNRDLGHIQFINNVGSVFVDSLIGVQFITNDFGGDASLLLVYRRITRFFHPLSSCRASKYHRSFACFSRLTQAEITALTAPSNGMVVYNTDTHRF